MVVNNDDPFGENWLSQNIDVIKMYGNRKIKTPNKCIYCKAR